MTSIFFLTSIFNHSIHSSIAVFYLRPHIHEKWKGRIETWQPRKRQKRRARRNNNSSHQTKRGRVSAPFSSWCSNVAGDAAYSGPIWLGTCRAGRQFREAVALFLLLGSGDCKWSIRANMRSVSSTDEIFMCAPFRSLATPWQSRVHARRMSRTSYP